MSTSLTDQVGHLFDQYVRLRDRVEELESVGEMESSVRGSRLTAVEKRLEYFAMLLRDLGDELEDVRKGLVKVNNDHDKLGKFFDRLEERVGKVEDIANKTYARVWTGCGSCWPKSEGSRVSNAARLIMKKACGCEKPFRNGNCSCGDDPRERV